MANVLIVGCGDLGCRLGTKLAESGHSVYGLRRQADLIPEPIQAIQANLSVPITNLPDKLDYVYYIVSAGKYKDPAYYQAYVLGVKNTLQALKSQKIKRFFFVSSTSVFGQEDGEFVNELSPTIENGGFSTKRLLEGETLVNESRFPSTIIRFGGIYGPGRTHLIDLVMEGKVHCMEGVWSNRIHTEDCVGILNHLFELNEADANQVDDLYIGVDDTPTLSCEVYDWLAEQLSVPDVEHIEPKESSRQMRSNKRLSNARVRASGYDFIYPSYEDGYRELI
ncbi:NAD-dependent epimerase/dehydratase family protein [Thiomicrorhabdus sediminis]|uniref:NAD-dependent epimerase/dehydratase family protein n=1 Tax=Thiomicrorhabdus sediminis TaxID=2580412 RepID=A0A4P9K8C3_9GAMM|nr:NAD-dependent epimerase/dehydratase family protein [Thiomicrorhabdus sediminis]QCU90730.1 NAD-dependent epimerase/dehydratase family protein [Thiomicrorhabdus sediminis]